MTLWVSLLLGLLALPLLGWAALRVLWLSFARLRYVAYVRHKGLPTPSPSLHDHLRDEWANTRLALWRLLPGGSGPWTPEVVRGAPVVLVHGFVGRGSDFRLLRRALHDAGRPTCAPDLGWTFQGVASYAPPLEHALEQATEAGPVDVVAHSMGALVLRTVLAERPDLAAAVRRVVTLGAPHAGTASARGLPPGQPRDLDDLKRSSAFLEQLPQLTVLVDPERVVTLAGTHDLVVYPPQTCHAPGARNVDLPLGHSELLMAPQAVRRVLQALEAP